MSKEHYARIADLYDGFVQTDYDVAFFIQEARRVNAEVLELMAGTGRLSIPMLEAGIPLTCVDYSAEMLDRLRAKLKDHQASVHEADVRQFDLGRQFRQIILPFQAFPEITAEADQLQALQSIRNHLTPDGEFICTLHNPPVRLKSVDDQLRLVARHPQADGGQLLVWLLQRYDAASHVVEVLEFFELYDSQGTLTSKRYSPLQFHLLEKAQFERLIDAAGFRVAQLYGDYQYNAFDEATSPFMIWVLTQRL